MFLEEQGSSELKFSRCKTRCSCS